MSLALMAAECAARPVPDLLVRQALSVLRSPGRAELVCAKPAVLLDGVRRFIAPLPQPEFVVVTGSLYVVAEARGLFRDLADPELC
jgi:folylpolyglutamate synthase/dihydropteroate synthase